MTLSADRLNSLVEPYNLIVVKWGNLYGPEYVINLYEGAKRYTKVPFNFYVFTDDTTGLPQDKGWHFIKLPEFNVREDRGWWYKMEIFHDIHKLKGKNLYIDLDTVIIRDLEPFWDLIITDGLYLCRDFNRQFAPSYQAYNSSVMGWRNSKFEYLYYDFMFKLEKNMEKYRGDQDFIQVYAKSKFFWPDELAMSWKWECWNGGKLNPNVYKHNNDETIIKPTTAILVFHGKPKPEHCEDPKIVEWWRGTVKYK